MFTESAQQLKFCILGGTGFVGRKISADLAEQGCRVSIPTRRRERSRKLLVWPSVSLVEGDVHDLEFLKQQIQDVDVVINLVGILNESGHRGTGFKRAHTDLAEILSTAINETGVPRLLHMSALNASGNAPSHYLRTKAEAEDILHRTENCAVTSFRPSVIFGEEDSFTNRFAKLLKQIPLVFPLAKPESRFQPVWVDNVAQSFIRSIDDHYSFGRRYELGGPSIYTLFEIVDYLGEITGHGKTIIRLKDWQSWCQAATMEWIPGKPFSLDNLESLRIDSVCQSQPSLPFDIRAVDMKSIAPSYLSPSTNTLDRIRVSRPFNENHNK